jgi:hypothetical protein
MSTQQKDAEFKGIRATLIGIMDKALAEYPESHLAAFGNMLTLVILKEEGGVMTLFFCIRAGESGYEISLFGGKPEVDYLDGKANFHRTNSRSGGIADFNARMKALRLKGRL